MTRKLVTSPFRLGGAAAEGTARVYGRTLDGFLAVAQSLDSPVGLTPKEEIWRLNKAVLYRYKPVKPAHERHPVPLLLVYALINKPFIFDLGPGRSFVEFMVSQGFDIYLLDWGEPGLEDRNISFTDYVTEYLTRAVRKMLRHAGATEYSMLGYCLGATLAVIYAAYYAKVAPDTRLRNLILLTAPIDFTPPLAGSLATWLDEGTMDVDALVETFENVPGQLIELWAKLLKPAENYVGSYTNLWRDMHNAATAAERQEAIAGWQAINRWVEDVIPVTGAAMRQFVIEIVRDNALVQGNLRIDGRPVELGNIRANLCNIIAEYDHLVAPSQSTTLTALVGSTDKTQKIIASTHVGIMASRRAKYKLWPELAAWLGERSGQ